MQSGQLECLYSPEQVREMFPDNRRPSLKRLIAKAKQAGCCVKLGRGIGFTQEQVSRFFDYLTVQAPKAVPRHSRRGTPPPAAGSSYLKALRLLENDKPRKPKAGG